MNQLRNGKVPRNLSSAITVVPALSEVAFPNYSEYVPSYFEREHCVSSINSFDTSTPRPMCVLASNFTSDLYINISEPPNGKLSSESYAIDTSGCDSSLPPTQSSYKSNPSSLRIDYPKVSVQNSWSQEPLPGIFVSPTSIDFFDQQDVAIFDQQIQENIVTSPNSNLGKQNEWFSSGTSWQYMESSDSAGSMLKAVDAASTTPSIFSHCHAQRNTSNLPNFNELCSEATPKAIQKVMKVEGLTIYHVKSHLQKYRTVHHQPELSDGESAKRSGQVDEVSSQPLKGMETCEGLRVQIGLQKQLHEQLEIQRNLQMQVEEHSKYLAMMIAKQSESLKQLGALPKSLDAPTQILDNRETSMGQTGDADSAEQKSEK